jgi:peptide deformylase
MKQIITALIGSFMLLSIHVDAQIFSPSQYLNTEIEPARVFKNHLETDFSVLTSQSLEVDLNDTCLRDLVSTMFKTVTDSLSRGVGIAAPQIGINKRVILVQRFDKVDEPFEAYINPKILQYSKLMALRAEGCLSIDNFREEVERSYAILIEYYTIDGKKEIEMIEDFTARIFQHEIDHLDGILFTERIKAKN